MTQIALFLATSSTRSGIVAFFLFLLGPITSNYFADSSEITSLLFFSVFQSLSSLMALAISGFIVLVDGFSLRRLSSLLPIISIVILALFFSKVTTLVFVFFITTFFAWVLRHWSSWVFLLKMNLVVCILTSFLGPFFYNDLLTDMSRMLDIVFSDSTLRVKEINPSEMIFDDDTRMAIVNGVVTLIQGLISLLAVLIARNWQAKAINPGGFKTEFEAIRLPIQFSLLCLTLVIAPSIVSFTGSLGNVILISLMPALIQISFASEIPLIFAGIALVHGLSSQRKSKFLLVLFYTLLFLPIFNFYMLMLLVLVATADSFFNFRKLNELNH